LLTKCPPDNEQRLDQDGYVREVFDQLFCSLLMSAIHIGPCSFTRSQFGAKCKALLVTAFQVGSRDAPV
jgi:hypothetical protein